MKRFALISVLITLTVTAFAQAPADTIQRRQEWMREMRENKHNFLIRELQLTPEQQERFFTIYDRMDDEMMRIGNESRDIEHNISSMKTATDNDYARAVEIMYTQRRREAAVEEAARKDLSQILSPKQMFDLKKAERKYMRALMNHHRNSRKSR